MCRRAGLVLPALFVHLHFTARNTPPESIRPAAVWAIVVLVAIVPKAASSISKDGHRAASRSDESDVDRWWTRRGTLRFVLFESQKMFAYWIGAAD